MTLKSILAVASGEREDAQLISAAAKLAARFSGHVRVVPAFPDPAADLVYYGTALRASREAAERIEASEREAQARVEAAAQAVADREGLSGDPAGAAASIVVEKRALQPAVALAPAAVLADLVMFAASAARSPVLAGLFAETLLATRAPTLLLKARRRWVGWSPSPGMAAPRLGAPRARRCRSCKPRLACSCCGIPTTRAPKPKPAPWTGWRLTSCSTA
jgi:hypothetical protein